MPPIDPNTFDRYHEAVARAQELGMSVVELLDRRELLLTAARRKAIQMELLEDLIRRFELQTPNKLLMFHLGHPKGSASEMKDAVEEWLITMARNVEQGTLPDL